MLFRSLDYDTEWDPLVGLGGENLITTMQLSVDGNDAYHASMAEQLHMPSAVNGGGDTPSVVLDETHLLYLFPGYLAGVCSL